MLINHERKGRREKEQWKEGEMGLDKALKEGERERLTD